MRPSLPLALAAAALLAACAKQEPAPEPVRAVRTMAVSTDTAGITHDYAAEVRARTESRLGFRVAGKLVQRPVNLGDTVKRGQLLGQVDAQDLRLGQDAARAAMQAAQVNFEQASADFRRFKDLREQGFISAAELERRDTALKSAKAQLEQARAQAGVQGNQAAYASLVADAAGVVTGVEAEPGAVVAAGTPIVRVAHDGPRDVVFSVPEHQVGGVRTLAGKPGALSVVLWGTSRETVPATVREIAAAADPVTRTVLVKADIGHAAARLGQTATVSIAQPRVAGITKLPLAAVIEQQGTPAVWVVDKPTMTVKRQPIQVGGAEGNAVVVTGGLAPGQLVVTAGAHVLTQGLKVKLYNEPSTVAQR